MKMFQIFPDVVFTNGGYVAFPVLVSARVLKIPVIIHVSDTVPSRVLLFAGKFADKISISFVEAAKYFPKEKTALLGNPVRDEIKRKQPKGAFSFLHLDPTVPVLLVLGGSQGSQIINETVVSALPKLVEKYQIIHQTGKDKYDDIYGFAGVVLLNNPLKSRYKVFPYLDDLALKMSAGAASLVLARAGANTIFEIASWGLPSVLIPISKTVSRDQESNAFAYARSGAATVIRQKNLTPNILINEINRILDSPEAKEQMAQSAKAFFKDGAAEKIAKEILKIGLSHES